MISVEVLLHGTQLLAYCGLSDTIEFCCFGKAFVGRDRRRLGFLDAFDRLLCSLLNDGT